LDLLNVLGRLIELEPAQADLLARICAEPLLTADDLRDTLAKPAKEILAKKRAKKGEDA
jgi:hypothetical protein